MTNLALPTHPLFKNLAGKRFGRLVVVRYAGTCVRGGQKKTLWECRCDCSTVVQVIASSLQKGTQSCGCLHREVVGDSHRTHGKTKTPEYSVWSKMIGRCEDTTNKSFPNYGGRGIRVCERWRNNFADFLADMGPRPSTSHEIDRYPNNNGNYEPGNCRWTTRLENSRNKRNNHLVEFNGETLCVTQWVERTGLPRHVIEKRLRVGWSVADALTKPLRKMKRRLATK